MKKIISYSKIIVVIAALLVSSGYSLSNVFAEEYVSIANVAVVDETDAVEVTDADISPAAEVDSPDAILVADANVAPAAEVDEPDTTPIVDADVSPAAEVDEEDTTPSPTPTDNNGGNGGGNGGGRRSNSNGNGIGQVLGASDFQFLTDLREGMSGNDVMELQKRLRAEGYFTYPTDTGYFGPFTKISVMLYQLAHFSEIGYITGFFGPLTRAVING